MAFNTGNALGSTDPRDLSDNAENLDRFANGTDPAYNDRLSKSRKSLAGMESDFATDQSERATTFANFLASSGYEFLGEYAGGIEVTEYNQIIRESGEFWRPAASTSLPYTTTGAGMPESGAFVAVGDAALRQEIGSGIFRADSLANLESTNGRFDGDAARLVSGTGRDGDFRWGSSDLSATLVLASATSDSVDDTTDTINDADHPFSDGDGVITQTTVNGLTAQTVYWVVNSTSGTYQLSATFGGGAIDLTGTTNVTIDHLLDPLQGVYVTPSSDKTGASGAWVRDISNEISLEWFEPTGDGSDDAASIISCLRLGSSLFWDDATGTGCSIVGGQGKVYGFTGRIQMFPGTHIDFGRGAASASLKVISSGGGIDTCGASSLVAEVLAQEAGFIGPALNIDALKANDAGRSFGRGKRICRLDVGLLGARQAGSIGVVYSDLTGAPNGVAWTEAVLDIDEFDYGLTLEVDNAGFVNENWIDARIYDAVEYIRKIVGASGEVSSNRMNVTTQTGMDGRSGIAMRSDGFNNDVNITVWDWLPAKVDAAYSGTAILLSEDSGANNIWGRVSRSFGLERDLIVDLSPAIRKNKILAGSSRQPAPSDRSSVPGTRRMLGDQNDVLAFSDKRYTVASGGTNPPDAANLEALFRPAFNLLSVNSVTDFTVTVDFGVTIPGNEISEIGVELAEGAADRPDKFKIEASTDGSTWTSQVEAGYDGDSVPREVVRVDGASFSNARYLRLVVENDSAHRIRISRFHCYLSRFGADQFYGAWAQIFEPTFYGQVEINDGGTFGGLSVAGSRVVRERLAAVPDASGGTEIATINDILARMRSHGLIDP